MQEGAQATKDWFVLSMLGAGLIWHVSITGHTQTYTTIMRQRLLGGPGICELNSQLRCQWWLCFQAD